LISFLFFCCHFLVPKLAQLRYLPPFSLPDIESPCSADDVATCVAMRSHRKRYRGLPISDSENCGQYRNWLRLVASFGNQEMTGEEKKEIKDIHRGFELVLEDTLTLRAIEWYYNIFGQQGLFCFIF
jgi:hypothetical protein